MKINRKSSSDWQSQNIIDFWDYFAQRKDLHNEYFSRRYGKCLAMIMNAALPLRGLRVLDFGCGPGYFINHLLEAGATVMAVDSSPNSVEQVNQMYQGRHGWCGAKVIGDDASLAGDEGAFDFVCCIETIEHIRDDELKPLFNAIFRLVRPGGMAMFSTPCDENLLHNHVYCPFCNAEFHRWQHMRSFGIADVESFLNDAGFCTLFCRGVEITKLKSVGLFSAPLRKWSLDLVSQAFKRKKNRILDKLAPRSFPDGRELSMYLQNGPHLVAIAKKPFNE